MLLPESLKAVVWDLDGTLVDSAPDLAAALNTLLGEHGFEGHSVKKVTSMIGNGVKRLVELGFEAAHIPLPAEETEATVMSFMEMYSANANTLTRPYPYVLQMMKSLDESGVRQGLCTNKPEAVSRKIADALGLGEFIQSVVGGDSTPATKPDSRPLMACLDALGACPSTSVMIGDSAVDIDTARKLQMPVAVVNWGYANVPVEQLGADFILSDPTDLPRLLHSIFNDTSPTAKADSTQLEIFRSD